MNQPPEEILEIRLNFLEEDVAQQPKLRRQWGFELAKAKRELAIAKRNVKLLKAELGRAFRMDSRVNLGRKVTEGSTEEYIQSDDAFNKAELDVIEREYEVDWLKEMVEALEDRKEQLSNEVKLHGQGYWSKPWTKTTPVPSQAERLREAQQSATGDMGISKPKSPVKRK